MAGPMRLLGKGWHRVSKAGFQPFEGPMGKEPQAPSAWAIDTDYSEHRSRTPRCRLCFCATTVNSLLAIGEPGHGKMFVINELRLNWGNQAQTEAMARLTRH